ncbi:MAG: hypothetical protein HZC41_25385 [Chloroflexi bacterium]|nr:hypothetical protein [Chloroflexota bacterium]
MAEAKKPKPLLLLDSSPLITLALFPVHQPALETILTFADVVVVETVAVETTTFLKYRDAVVIKSLLDAQQIKRYETPATKYDDLIRAYNKVDEGERDTIRLALTMPDARLVLDDVAGFMAATHFDLNPIMLPDMLVALVRAGNLDKSVALRIISSVATRYSEAIVNTTKFKLGEL